MYHKDTEFLVAKRLEALVLLDYCVITTNTGEPGLDSYQPAPNG